MPLKSISQSKQGQLASISKDFKLVMKNKDVFIIYKPLCGASDVKKKCKKKLLRFIKLKRNGLINLKILNIKQVLLLLTSEE